MRPKNGARAEPLGRHDTVGNPPGQRVIFSIGQHASLSQRTEHLADVGRTIGRYVGQRALEEHADAPFDGRDQPRRVLLIATVERELDCRLTKRRRQLDPDDRPPEPRLALRSIDIATDRQLPAIGDGNQ